MMIFCEFFFCFFSKAGEILCKKKGSRLSPSTAEQIFLNKKYLYVKKKKDIVA